MSPGNHLPDVTLPKALVKSYKPELKLLAQILEARARQPGIELRDTPLRSLEFEEREQSARVVTAALALANSARQAGGADLVTLCDVLQHLLRSDLGLDRSTLAQLLDFITTDEQGDFKTLPINGLLLALEQAAVSEPISSEWQSQLRTLAPRIEGTSSLSKASATKLVARIEKLCAASLLTRFVPDEGWADQLRADLTAMNDSQRLAWEALLQQAAAVIPQPPADSWDVPWDVGADVLNEAVRREHTERVVKLGCCPDWLARLRELITIVGEEDYRTRLSNWLHSVPKSKPGHLARSSLNREVLRGLLWSLQDQPDEAIASAIGVAASYLYLKNSPLGLDSVRVLAHLATPEALHQLTLLAGRVKAANQRETIQTARTLVADQHEIALEDLDDLAIPTSGFTELGRRRQVLSGFTAEITIDRRSATLRWFKPNGQPQASVPAVVKREHTPELNDLKRSVKEVETTLAQLSTRFESAPLAQRSWSLPDWQARYLQHPVAGTIVRRLVWNITQDGQQQSAVWADNQFVTHTGEPLLASGHASLSVWHPIFATVEDVVAWRNWFTDRQITQPFKQAHREIYLLTDAERNTGTYSNRFASHILKQSQFRALAKTRGWKSDYLGMWDGGADGSATLALPRWQLRAELWCGASGTTSDVGYTHVATDQVRFSRLETPQEPLPLADVPPLVFSEVLRDVDLFVGVASVGNDPHWHDGGPGAHYRDYWQEYSFGSLSESANTRRAVLERLIPRLSIADRCRFDGRFLIVRGDLRTYKIHLGSGNILMEPNDQYLCIVPDQHAPGQDLYLPFEGDSRLSLILSKALLLAADTTIKDRTILSQLSQR